MCVFIWVVIPIDVLVLFFLFLQYHTHLHLIQCDWWELRFTQGLLQHHPSSQQQQGAGGAHAAADGVSGESSMKLVDTSARWVSCDLRQQVQNKYTNAWSCALPQVDEIYTVPEVGTVVGGTLYRSVWWKVFSLFKIYVFYACTLSDCLFFGVVQWDLPWRGSSCCRAHRIRPVPQVDHRQHPKESLGMQGAQGRPGSYTCTRQLWPIAVT